MEDFEEIKKIYFVGIGGIGMSAAAGIAKNAGFKVQGSDCANIYSPAKDVLDKENIPYNIGYKAEHINRSGGDLFVLSAGEDLNNPEVKYIYEHNLPHVGFAELLYQLTKEKLRVVVTGTHGKSTTTALLGATLKNIDNSSFIAGAVLKNFNTNFHHGDGHYFVFEGDEYKEEWDDPTPKFHFYKPDILVLTNLEFDHPDVFANMEDLENEFRQLIAALPEDGLIVHNADDINVSKLVHESSISAVSFGIDNPADYQAQNITYERDYTTIEVTNKFSKQISSQLLGQTEQYKTQLAGKMNVYNALAVIATLRALGFQQNKIALELVSFQGIKRRFETVGVVRGIRIIDDYAHHPTAVLKSIEAARERFPKSRIWAIFEPHTFSRTQATQEDLSRSFDGADEVLLSKIYPAREKFKEGMITSEQVVQKINDTRLKIKDRTPARLVQTKDEALKILESEVKSGDIIITMAVGDFNRLSYELKELLQ